MKNYLDLKQIFNNANYLDTDYFWSHQNDIPDGMGYELFGPAHLISVFLTLLAVVLFCIFFKKRPEEKQRKILKIFPLVMIVLEIMKDSFLVAIHRFGIGYLPLHFCSFGIYVFTLREYLPWKWAKDWLGEEIFTLTLPGSIFALFFADWAVYYPPLNAINIHSYIWHGMLVLYPILIKMKGDVQPSVKHIYRVIIFLLVVVPPIYIFDKKVKCNYFFVNWPVPNSPLSLMAKYMGVPGYLIGYAALAVVVMLVMYLINWGLDRIKKVESAM